MHYLLLGPMSVLRDNESVVLGGLRQRGVLAALLLAGARTIETDALVDMVWGNAPPPKPMASLRAYVANLRRILSGDRLVTDRNGYRLQLASDRLDIREFESQVAEGRRLRAAGDDVAAAHVLDRSLRLWRGAPLADFRDQPFTHYEVHRLEVLRADALEARFDAQLSMGGSWELIAPLESAVAAEPLQEKLWAQLMLAMHRAGRRADALHAYQRVWALLDAELGIRPGAELQRLAADIRGDSSGPRTSHLVGRPLEVLRVHSALRAAGRGSARTLPALPTSGS